MDKNENHIIVWDRCLKIIKDIVSSVAYRTWFVPIVPISLEKETIRIQVESDFIREFLEENYIDLLKKVLKREIGENVKLEYKVKVVKSKKNETHGSLNIPANSSSTRIKNSPISIGSVNEENKIKNPFIVPGLKKLQIDSQLNHNYTIENFIEGDYNRLARTAGMSIASQPGETAFNPFFIYGNSGLGKTHLAQAIGIKIKEKFPKKTVLYINANKFETQYVESIRNNNRNNFLHFYQLIDVLIIDDIQDLAGKTKTQETFFHIFNQLHQNNKQLIITSDKPPAELDGLEQRLVSRFKWGLSAELLKPDKETKIAILKKKIYQTGISLDDKIIEYIASKIQNNIRELEGTLNSLLAQATFNKREITLELAIETVNKLVKTQIKEINITNIQKTVSEFFNVSIEKLKSDTRKREIVQARQIAMFFAKKYTKASLSSIGAQIGKKDHATVLYACKIVNNLIETDKKYKYDIEELDKKIQDN